jgi:transposase-like protein
MLNINEAINDLKETVIQEGFSEDAVVEIAEEWDVNAAALVRKFEEKTGKHPKDFSAGKIEIDYEKIYNAGMSRAWKSHPKMQWKDLTEKEKEQTALFLERNLAKKDELHIVWK